MKLLHLQKYLGFAGIAAAIAFFYTDYLLETDKESFHILSNSSIALMQSAAFVLVLLFFISNTVFVQRRLSNRAFKKPLAAVLITGVLSLVLPAMLFFDWLWKMLQPKKEPTVMEAVGSSIGDAIFAHTKKIESLQNTANMLFLLLGLIILAVLVLAVINARKKTGSTAI